MNEPPPWKKWRHGGGRYGTGTSRKEAAEAEVGQRRPLGSASMSASNVDNNEQPEHQSHHNIHFMEKPTVFAFEQN